MKGERNGTAPRIAHPDGQKEYRKAVARAAEAKERIAAREEGKRKGAITALDEATEMLREARRTADRPTRGQTAHANRVLLGIESEYPGSGTAARGMLAEFDRQIALSAREQAAAAARLAEAMPTEQTRANAEFARTRAEEADARAEATAAEFAALAEVEAAKQRLCAELDAKRRRGRNTPRTLSRAIAKVARAYPRIDAAAFMDRLTERAGLLTAKEQDAVDHAIENGELTEANIFRARRNALQQDNRERAARTPKKKKRI